MKKIKLAAMAALILAMTSCGVSDAYLKADRDTFEAIAPDYSKYVNEDESLDAKDKEIFLRTISVWEERIKTAEELAK